jgi:hypothetical protein
VVSYFIFTVKRLVSLVSFKSIGLIAQVLFCRPEKNRSDCFTLTFPTCRTFHLEYKLKLGLIVVAPSGSTAKYEGPVYVDEVNW